MLPSRSTDPAGCSLPVVLEAEFHPSSGASGVSPPCVFFSEMDAGFCSLLWKESLWAPCRGCGCCELRARCLISVLRWLFAHQPCALLLKTKTDRAACVNVEGFPGSAFRVLMKLITFGFKLESEVLSRPCRRRNATKAALTRSCG